MIDSLIGKTPIVDLKRLVTPYMAEVWVKLETHNPGLSIKDRVALAMIQDAEERGVLRAGGTIIEPTSGNTGIGLAQIAACRGYKLVTIMQEHMSEERKQTLRAFGAEIVLVSSDTSPLEAIEVGRQLVEECNGWMPNQFDNPMNCQAHFQTTGPEIWEQMHGRVDVFIYATGTGGTISGVGRYLKQQNAQIEVIAVEPGRSNVLSGGVRGLHRFQGMGPGYIPGNLDTGILDRVVEVWEEDVFPFTASLAREEGLFVGMSSGAMIYTALQVARELGTGKRIVTIACDSGTRYLSTELFAPLSS